MRGLQTLFGVGAVCFALVGCQTIGNGKALSATTAGARTTTAGSSENSVVLGLSTKADVEREWGQASVTTFPSGYEVWVYQQTMGAPKLLNYLPVVQWFASGVEDRTTEVALLFGPEGVLRKLERRGASMEPTTGTATP